MLSKSQTESTPLAKYANFFKEIDESECLYSSYSSFVKFYQQDQWDSSATREGKI
jgi:hypothetical protein